jgi:hypothetical protein
MQNLTGTPDITPVAAPAGNLSEKVHESKSTKSKQFSKGKQAVGSGFHYGPVPGQYFRSRRVKPKDVQMPWLDKPHPRQKWGTILPLIGFGLGLIVVAIMIWDGFRVIGRHKYCEIYHDNFTSFNESVWTKEVELGGYGQAT